MAKFLVEGVVKFKMTVEADSEDEAMEMAEEQFDFATDVDSESLPEFQVANSIGGPDLDDDSDEVDSPYANRFNDDEDDE